MNNHPVRLLQAIDVHRLSSCVCHRKNTSEFVVDGIVFTLCYSKLGVLLAALAIGAVVRRGAVDTWLHARG